MVQAEQKQTLNTLKMCGKTWSFLRSMLQHEHEIVIHTL